MFLIFITLTISLALSILLIIGFIKFVRSITEANKKLRYEIETLLEVFRNLNQLQDENLEMYIRMLQQASQHHNQNQLF